MLHYIDELGVWVSWLAGGAGMRFGILGPLRVGAGAGAEPAVTAGRDRIVLSMLLLHPGRIVGVDELIDAVWENGPPVTARGQLQTCVSRLRRVLPETVIDTDPVGYAIRLGTDDLDAAVFARLTAAARAAAGRGAAEEGRRLYREALSLWRGPALVGMDCRAVRQGAAVLDEQHAVATEDWVDLALVGGRERELIGELTGLVERFPLRERLRAQLMVALYRAGRQADALAEYRRARTVLKEELGVDPGPALQDVHRRLLAGETDLADRGGPADGREEAAALAPLAPAATPKPVRCLPRTVGDFTGRGEAVGRLVQGIVGADPALAVIRLIDGMAGSGKTTLALHVAGLVGARYPDAQLFVDLHGHSRRAPLEPGAALVTLLRQLGVPAQAIPTELDERVALWRSELASRRALVVLDNAAGTAQVGPLLPAAAGCLALVTSRRRLTGLDGVRPESIQVMSQVEAVALLRRIAGERVDAEPDAAVEVVRRCGFLPLAIRLAGSRLAHRQRWRVVDLVHRLGEHGAALSGLAAEDRTVSAAFGLSYGQLNDAARRFFRLLGVHPVHRFDAAAAAALADVPLEVAQDLLDELVDAYLVEEPEAGLFRLHDLMREYAGSLIVSEAEAEAAVGRLVNHQLHACAALTRPLESDGVLARAYLTESPRRPDLIPPAGDTTRWLEQNRGGLLAVMEAAVRVGEHRSAWLLPRAMWRFLYTNGYHDELSKAFTRGLAVARGADDDDAAAMCLNYLASAHVRTGSIDDCLNILRQSLDIRLRQGDARHIATARSNLAAVLALAGRLPEALEEGLAALRIRRRLNDPTVIGLSLHDCGEILSILGRQEDALHYHRLHLLIAIAKRDDFLKALAFGSLVRVRLRMGQPQIALRLQRVAMRLRVKGDYHFGEAEGHNDLAIALHRTGRTEEAVGHHRRALELAHRRGEHRWEALFCNDYAATMFDVGDRAGALQLYQRALALALRSQAVAEQARAHDGIATCLAEDPDPAARHRAQAEAIRRWMASPGPSPPPRWAPEGRGGPDQLHEPATGGTMVG